MKTIIPIALVLTLAGCGSALFPGVAFSTDGSAVAHVTAGTEYVVLQGNAGGALRVMTRLAPNGPYTEAGSIPVGAGATRSWKVSWGGLGGEGWVDLSPVPCDEVRGAYPWVECPETPTVLKSAPSGEVVRFPAFVERR